MKVNALLIAGALCLQSCETITSFAKPKQLEQVRTTSYTHNEPDHYKYGKLTCLGTTLRHGELVSAASDWSYLPVGTKFKIAGCHRTYIIEDIGSALVGTKTVDIYTPCRKSMNKRGTKHVDITVVEHGCYRRSLDILRPRATRSKAARQMVISLEKIVNETRYLEASSDREFPERRGPSC